MAETANSLKMILHLLETGEYKKALSDFFHFLSSLSLVEHIVLGLICLLMIFAFLKLFMTFFGRIVKITTMPFRKKGKQIAKKTENGKVVLPKSMDYKNGFFSTTWNYVRFFKGMVSLARIEEDIKKDKPVRLNLSQAIFMIQNFGNYNYFASEDGRVLFEKIKRDIDSDKKEMFAIPERNKGEKDNIFTLERLKEITSDNIHLEFNEEGNLTGFVDKQEERQKIGAELAKEITASLEDKSGGQDYAKWSAQKDDAKIAPKQEEKEAYLDRGNNEGKILPQKDKLQYEPKSEPKQPANNDAPKSAKDLRQEMAKNKRQNTFKKNTDEIEVIEMHESLAKLAEMEDFAENFYDEDLMKPTTTKTPKKKRQKGAENTKEILEQEITENKKPEQSSAPTQMASRAEHTKVFVSSHCSKEDLANGLIFFDKERSMLLFKKDFFIKFGKPVLAEREPKFWASIEKRFNIKLAMNVACLAFCDERVLGLRIEDTEWLQKELLL